MTHGVKNSIVALRGNDVSVGESYCSFDVNTQENRKLLYNAINNTDFALGEVQDVIYLKDIYAEKTSRIDDETGEEVDTISVYLIDNDGKTYHSVSRGIVASVQRLLTIFGEPQTWKESLAVKVNIKSIDGGRKQYKTLEIV